MNSSRENIALADCKIWRPGEFNGKIEIVYAEPAFRKFPTRVNESLGICLKLGPPHSVICDGRNLIYPADAICIRYPGTIWSCETANAAFISADIDPELLPLKIAHQPMRFFSSEQLPISAKMILDLVNAEDRLRKEEVCVEMIHGLSAGGALDRDLIQDNGNSKQALAHAREFMIAHFDQLPTLDEIAEAASSNKYVLVRHFRNMLGITPHQFLLGIRIEKVRNLLTRGASAAEAAAYAGFFDQSHLNRHFRRIVGLTPNEYRKRIRKLYSLS